MEFICLTDHYALRKLLKRTNVNLTLPIRDSDYGCFFLLHLHATSKLIVFTMTEDDLQYRIYIDFKQKNIYNVEEIIYVFDSDTNLWRFTDYDNLTEKEKKLTEHWFMQICPQLCNSFYSISGKYHRDPFVNYQTNLRIRHLIQTCTPDVKQIVIKYIDHIKKSLNKRRSFFIWKEWYFYPKNPNGFIKRFKQ